MESDLNQTTKAGEDPKVPEALLQKLHQANQRFHSAKEQVETMTAAAAPDHQDHLDKAQEELKVAEREVENITLEIQGSLKPPSAEKNH